MKIDDPKIASLREKVNAAHQEFEMAVTFHEVWKPAAFDDDLHKRMGASYATNAFFCRAGGTSPGNVARVDATLGQGR
jgi:hypothetical protein